ncbi:DNA-binding transcriptional regulator, MerR family [Lentzea fradiae]|uniref:DNA-binding transcriptional regulator, MerR family n=1 Tax=Lentzea fradiae TaxID=200378 RepID=A0A1G8BIR1_9PSEU|nr:MerR family transcriptional regulator [Lentzea fradiae]SDH33021.1 DNA-binding transcriptional regulator, MerR family [Lentzea fradiae]
MAENDLMPIGRVAQWFGMRVPALRFYEEQGLLTTRRRNGRRHFDRNDLLRLALVRTYVEGGMLSLDEVKELVATEPTTDARLLAERHVSVLREHASSAAAALRLLRHHIDHDLPDQLSCPRCAEELRDRLARFTRRRGHE